MEGWVGNFTGCFTVSVMMFESTRLYIPLPLPLCDLRKHLLIPRSHNIFNTHSINHCNPSKQYHTPTKSYQLLESPRLKPPPPPLEQCLNHPSHPAPAHHQAALFLKSPDGINEHSPHPKATVPTQYTFSCKELLHHHYTTSCHLPKQGT